ncbi:MAG: protein-glutamate methylesterase/protein-glutamine glutaminase [Fimbriimonas sp.]
MTRTRVLVVDDSPLLRRVIVDMISAEEDLEVVGQGRTGEDAVRLTAELRPDVVTLDVEMPRMDGLEALRRIMKATPTPVLMVSSLTAAGTHATMEALHAGAVDCLGKPRDGALSAIRDVREELIGKIRVLRHATLRGRASLAVRPSVVAASSDAVVVVAASTGGPRALSTFFEGLPKDFPAPILIVQHMPMGFVASLARRLDAIGTMPCAEAAPGARMTSRQALIAPSGTHMRVFADGHLEFTDEPTLHGVRPAADHLFTSAAEAFGARCVGVVMTGMGRDGAEGARAIKAAGGSVLAEDESTCVVYGMPRAAVVAGAVDHEIPIHRMAEALSATVSASRRSRRAS